MSISGPLPSEIKAFRASVGGWSQAELAAALGVSKRTVEEWEKPGTHRAPGYLRYAFSAINRGLVPWADSEQLQITQDGDGWRVRVSSDLAVAGEPVVLAAYPSEQAALKYVEALGGEDLAGVVARRMPPIRLD